MGSGKSSVGRALALLLRWKFVDLDLEIERSEGQSIREIFRTRGEDAFRGIESSLLRSLLCNTSRPLVLATGGGTFVQSQNAELLRRQAALVVFLDARPQRLLQRCSLEGGEGGDNARPLAAGREEFLRLYEQRLPFYRTADLTVDSNDNEPAAVAQEIAERLALDFVSKLPRDG